MKDDRVIKFVKKLAEDKRFGVIYYSSVKAVSEGNEQSIVDYLKDQMKVAKKDTEELLGKELVKELNLL